MASKYAELTPIRPNPPFRVGLIGVTGYGYDYFKCLTDLVEQGRVEWGAVTIINPDEAKERIETFENLRVPIFADYRQMLELEGRNLDWVCIPTGIGFHKQMAIDCLKLGLQILVEKPLAPVLQDIEAIQAAEREANVIASVGFQHTYVEDTWKIKKRLLEGAIGQVQRVDCLGLWPRSRDYYHRNEWAGRLRVGDSWILDSPFHNGLSHLVNLILFWLGDTLESGADPKRVSAELYRVKSIESFDTVRSVATTEGGVEAAVTVSHGSLHNIDPEIRITGSEGQLHWRYSGTHLLESDSGTETIVSPNPIEIRKLMFDAVVDRIGGGEARNCSTGLARGVCKWANAIHDTCPIENIPDKFRVTVSNENGEVHDAIDNLEYFALKAHNEGISLKAAGAPWAIEPIVRDVSDYGAFEGKFCYPVEGKDRIVGVAT